MDRYMTAEEVAEALSVHVETLRRWRREKKGPPWIQLTERVVRYDREDIEAWMRDLREDGGENDTD